MLYPRRFFAWSWVKTIIQLSIAFVSLQYITQSGFFVPFGFTANVWPPAAIGQILLAQAVFEVGDLASEMWMLKKSSSRGHLPWDSILHHTVSSLYGFYVYAFAEHLDANFLGLAASAPACQLIGPLYTLHRWRWRHRYLALAILTVQLLFRTPLAIVSVLRAAQFYTVVPWPHFVIICALAYLDYKWLMWAFSQHRRLQADYARRKETWLQQQSSDDDGEQSPAECSKSMASTHPALKTL